VATNRASTGIPSAAARIAALPRLELAATTTGAATGPAEPDRAALLAALARLADSAPTEAVRRAVALLREGGKIPPNGQWQVGR
jgi:phosphoglycolate phosphatase-like HAD superfamily hydrolase